LIPQEIKDIMSKSVQPEDVQQAKDELSKLEKLGQMHLSKNPETYALQVKCFAWGIRTKKDRPPQTPADVVDELAAIRHERTISKELVGTNSIYSNVSFSDAKTQRTKVLKYLFEDFHYSGKNNLLILGGVGSGKTFGAIAYVGNNARLWHHKGIPVIDALFVRAYTVGEFIQRKAWDKLDEIRNKKWLIVDDLGIEGAGYKSTDFHSFFEDLFIHRHEQQKRTLMTSNATTEQVKETFGDRFLSRLRETGSIFETDDADMRRIDANAV